MRRLLVLLTAMLSVGCTAPTADPVTVELDVPEAGIAQPLEQHVDLGAEVTLRITSAVDDELHVHGYELHIVTPAGETVEEVFEADMSGSYEIESHQAGQVYMNLIVS
ncbi:hypothetical protein [Tessaracoccus oleiagri]|uniref:Cupredoxin-like domain-containing protein n=1 Tax=Tessaracoccus oleiagri TaxID=686624 RepID=A0A1G9MM03_9ACTN|nr:hypothetical protein [Tessaracoccus oleiagri]SDL75239.1 hypothetical protein SAMN04488242_2718 [Tessaracoccus oleiagri]